VVEQSDVDRLVAHIEQQLGPRSTWASWPGGWPDQVDVSCEGLRRVEAKSKIAPTPTFGRSAEENAQWRWTSLVQVRAVVTRNEDASGAGLHAEWSVADVLPQASVTT
jgi:hypothetical protein